MLTALALPLALLALQEPPQQISDRLAGRVSPDIAALATELGTSAAARGLPVDPLLQKAIEGSAKAVPAERIATAMRLVLSQLSDAAGALESTDTVAIAAGAFALNAGLTAEDIRELAKSGGDVTVGLRVAGTLVAIGVPRAETVTLVNAMLASGGPASELLALPGRVQAQMARGIAPAQAAAGLARAAAAQSRRGPPPSRGQPPPRPAPPPPSRP